MDIIASYTALGKALKALASADDTSGFMLKVSQENPWFTREEVVFALLAWSDALEEVHLRKWLSAYTVVGNPKKVGLILAGNVPLVGLHDVLSVLASGHQALIKPSSDDRLLFQKVISLLQEINPALVERISFVERLTTVDALIATGSNNSSRYFEYYFKHIPHIIRKNRNSLAVLQGNETDEALFALGEDIFRYYGLGCRNVSKLFVPEGYRFDRLFEVLEPYRIRMNSNTRYANNLDYNLALLLVNREAHLTNHLFILREQTGLGSPISVIFYETYQNLAEVREKLLAERESLQCVIGHPVEGLQTLPFGQSQCPALWDYADGVDTMAFLTGL